MKQSSMVSIAGNVLLALMLSAVFSISVMAVIVSDYLTLGKVINSQENSTIMICAVSAGISAIVVWLLQEFAAGRGLIVRLMYALVMLILVFGAAGGALFVANNYFSYNATTGSLFQGFFWESVNGFYSFALFMITAVRPSLLALFFLGALYIALIGPQKSDEPSLEHLTL